MSGDASDVDDAGDEGIVEQNIVNEMDEVRDKLGDGIDRLSDDVRHVFDWQAYVRSAPLTSVGIAAVAGYLLAPALRSAPAPQPVQASPSKSEGGIFSTLTSLAMGSLVRIAAGYVLEMLTSPTAPPPDQVDRETVGSPADQPSDFGP